MTLRVALDVTASLSGATGIARYATELAAALEARGVDVRRYAVGRAERGVPPGTRRLPVPLRVAHPLWESHLHPRIELLTGRVEVVHTTGLPAPPSRAARVVTIHDLAALDDVSAHGDRTVRELRGVLGQALTADAILAVSDTTAASLLHHGVPRSRIHVTPNGVTRLPVPGPLPPGLDGQFVLAVGSRIPRKGLDVLLRAMTDPRLRSLGLVHAGPPGGADRALGRLEAELGLTGRVRWLGAVDDPTLAALYAGARALCYPSLAEGFGLPILEALSAGCPAVATDLPVHREVAASAALLVPPRDDAATASALARLVSDERLRDQLVAAGASRLARYTWDACAEATLAAYTDALARSRRPSA